MYVCMYVCIYVCMYVYIYIYIKYMINTYTHLMHTYIANWVWGFSQSLEDEESRPPFDPQARSCLLSSPTYVY